jgi:hypothetical protein
LVESLTHAANIFPKVLSMRHLLPTAFLGLAAMLVSQPCVGSSLTLGVMQDPGSHADLNSLVAGQSVTFDVTLSGLDVVGGQTLGSLLGTVAFDGTLLGQPLSITAGPIVPDPTGFLSAPAPGVADASYLALFSVSGAVIAGNGTFFIFTVVVQSNVTGSGSLSLDPASGGYVAAFDANNNPVDITAGPGLSFTVGEAAVPEPRSLAMAMIALALIPARVGLKRLLAT